MNVVLGIGMDRDYSKPRPIRPAKSYARMFIPHFFAGE